MTGTVCEEWRANTKILPAGEFGDAYADSREVLGLSILHQATYECLRDLGTSRVYQETLLCLERFVIKKKAKKGSSLPHPSPPLPSKNYTPGQVLQSQITNKKLKRKQEARATLRLALLAGWGLEDLARRPQPAKRARRLWGRECRC